jgi:hypothetical protein
MWIGVDLCAAKQKPKPVLAVRAQFCVFSLETHLVLQDTFKLRAE